MQKLQNLRAYRKVGRLFVGQRFTVKIATEGDDLSLTQLGLTYDSEIREWFSKVSARSRNFRFLARNGRRVAGMVTLTEFKSGSLQGWWLFGLTVRFRYRGFGIGERLVRKALEEAKRRGATDIRLLVYEEATPAIALYEKLGFYQVHLPELAKQLAEEFKVTGHQRIAMYKEL
jgi:GNAT superfamily N-acetyltransferase